MKKTLLTALAIALCSAFSYADIITQVQINVQTQDKSGIQQIYMVTSAWKRDQ